MLRPYPQFDEFTKYDRWLKEISPYPSQRAIAKKDPAIPNTALVQEIQL